MQISLPLLSLAVCTSLVYTIIVFMTLRDLFRSWPKRIAGRIRAWKYRALMRKLRYADSGRKFTRDEMNERR